MIKQTKGQKQKKRIKNIIEKITKMNFCYIEYINIGTQPLGFLDGIEMREEKRLKKNIKYINIKYIL